jgi:hypothetical protein
VILCRATSGDKRVIPPRHKFAALSLHGIGARIEFPDELPLPTGLIATRQLPFEITPWWREQLGILTCEEIEGSDLYLVATAPSESLSVLDGVNLALEDTCRNFFYGLLVAMPFSPELPPQMVTGSMDGGTARFRQIGRFERPAYIAGTPPPDLDRQKMEAAAFYASEIHSAASSQGAYGRTIWALNCFMNGLTSTHVYEKMRHLVRTIEAFILPDIGKTERQFKSRTELFVGAREHDLISRIYQLRSRIEHLHDPLELMPGTTTKDRLIALCEITLTTENLARYCVQRFFDKPGLRAHFENDDSINAFWRMSDDDRRGAWGEPVDMTWLRSQFDKDLARSVITL